MTDETPRTIEMSRLAKGRYVATNARGGRLVLGQGDESFSPVELLLVAIAGCSAIDVDFIVSKRAEPTRFDLLMSGDKIRDDEGNRMTNLTLTFDVAFPDDEGGRAAYDVLPRAVQQSHDRLCTVSRTVEVGSPITTRIEGLEG
jgi:putative redox protein